jgi:hypothetical protein
MLLVFNSRFYDAPFERNMGHLTYKFLDTAATNFKNRRKLLFRGLSFQAEQIAA